MKTLSILQPYASLIARGEKYVENRTWRATHRGPLLIHASAGKKLCRTQFDLSEPRGVVLAKCNLVECIPVHIIRSRCKEFPNERPINVKYTWKELDLHVHTEGPWCWILQDVEPLQKHYPAQGKLWLWDFELPE